MKQLLYAKKISILLGLLMTWSFSFTKTYYIAVDGKNTNDGSKEQPWAQINYALRQTQPGDTIYLVKGNVPFDEWVEIKSGQGGSDGLFKTITSMPGQRITLNGIVQIRTPYIRLENINIVYKNPGQRSAISALANHIIIKGNDVSGKGYWGGITVSGDDVLVESNTIHDFGVQYNQDHGIYISKGTNINVKNNNVHHNRAYGIHVYDHGKDLINNLVIDGNLVYENGNASWHSGIRVVGKKIQSIKIINNVIWGHYHSGMNIQASGIITSIYNNTVYEPDKTGICISNVAVLKIKNNLIYQTNTPLDIRNIKAEICDIDYNAFYPKTKIKWLEKSITHTEFRKLAFGINDVLEDPVLNNIKIKDFTLKSSSPAIDAGICVGLSFKGKAPDIGAFEYNSLNSPEINFIPGIRHNP